MNTTEIEKTETKYEIIDVISYPDGQWTNQEKEDFLLIISSGARSDVSKRMHSAGSRNIIDGELIAKCKYVN